MAFQPWQVNQICTGSGYASRYKGLFTQGYEDLEAANAHFSSAFGDSFAYLEPTVHQLMQQAAASTFHAPDMAPRRDICVSDAFASSMSLDMVRSNPRVCSLHPQAHRLPLSHLADRAELHLGDGGGLVNSAL